MFWNIGQTSDTQQLFKRVFQPRPELPPSLPRQPDGWRSVRRGDRRGRYKQTSGSDFSDWDIPLKNRFDPFTSLHCSTDDPCVDEEVKISNLPPVRRSVRKRPVTTPPLVRGFSPKSLSPSRHSDRCRPPSVPLSTPPTSPPLISPRSSASDDDLPASLDQDEYVSLFRDLSAVASVSSRSPLALPPRTQWHIPLSLFQIDTLGLLDSGSTFSLCHRRLVHTSLLVKVPNLPSLRTASSATVSVLGYVTTKVVCQTKIFEHPFLVCDSLAHPKSENLGKDKRQNG